jgi:hypothetical protein
MPSLTIATWNVENLFIPGPDEPPDKLAAFDAKLAFLGQTITALNPDVLALQEVGGDAALQALQAVVPAYQHRQIGIGDPRGIACAFLSKLPLRNPTDIVDFPQPVLALGASDQNGVPFATSGKGRASGARHEGRLLKPPRLGAPQVKAPHLPPAPMVGHALHLATRTSERKRDRLRLFAGQLKRLPCASRRTR